jgi:Protein of unknown function (DUF4236)/Bacterial SH3 domain
MGFRFQRRLKLFPGVRLNFSGGGISTTIGVRGASVTLGRSGAYVNVGLPGTGLSFREKLTHRPSEVRSRPSYRTDDQSELETPPPLHVPAPSQEPPVAGAIRSGPVSTMTSAGLDELKKLINEAALKRIELNETVSENEDALHREQRRLRRAQWFIVRLFTRRAVPRLVEGVNAAESSLASARQQLAGCSVEIDFAFDQQTLNTFAALVRSFEVLTKSQKIWDITASVLANRLVERTIASHSVKRELVALRISRSEIIDASYNALCITNANGNDMYVYPGFVMVPSPSRDFALIDVRELQVKFSQTNFIEEEGIPAESEVIGETWKKTNKDGSRDRRFVSNYQIPIVRYAEIEFRSSSGLYEVYQFSSFADAFTFNQSLTDYQQAVGALARRSSDPSVMPLFVPPQDDTEDIEAEPEVTSGAPEVSRTGPPRVLVFDWAALVVLVGALGAGGVHLTWHVEEIWAAIGPTFQSQIQGPPLAPSNVIPVVSNVPVPPTRPSVATALPPEASGVRPLASTPVKASAAAASREVVYVLKPNVNIRSEPSTVSQVLGSAKAGRKLTVFQRQSEWVQVGDGAPIGWVHQSLLGPMPP